MKCIYRNAANDKQISKEIKGIESGKESCKRKRVDIVLIFNNVITKGSEI